jgi:metal-responsive CopG/Arc/MetJ family transcriptional regulator
MRESGRFEQVTVRVPLSVLEALEAAAEQDRRLRSNLIRNVLTDWVAERSQEGGRTICATGGGAAGART